MNKNETLERNDIYLNPNWKPEAYLRYLKYLTIVYDRVFLWSPTEGDIATHVEDADDFRNVFLNSSQSVIIPTGRTEWFHSRTEDCGLGYKTLLRKIAEKHSSTLSTNDRNIGYTLLDEKWNNRLDQQVISNIMRDVKNEFSPKMLNRILELGERKNKPDEWALANAYIQDILAINQLKVIPFQSNELAMGYKVFKVGSKNGHQYESLNQPETNSVEFKNEEELKELEELVKYLCHVDSMSWSDVLEFKSQFGEKLSKWVKDIRKENTRSLATTAQELFIDHEKKSNAVTNILLALTTFGLASSMTTVNPAMLITGGTTLFNLLIGNRGKISFTSELMRKHSRNIGHDFLFDTPAGKNRAIK